MDAAGSSKEYIWCAKLSSKNQTCAYEGEDDGALEQLVLKRVCLAPGAKDNERNVVQVTSFDNKMEKVQACICSLRAGLKEDDSLSDITLFPPAVFKLVEGSGPVHLVANHMMLEDDEMSDEEFPESDEEEVENPNAMKRLQTNKKSNAVDGSEEEDSDEDDFDDEEFEDMDDDDEEEEEEPEEIIPKKRKLATNDENKKPQPVAKQAKNSQKNKTSSKPPLQQKQNKTPQSGKKPKGAMKSFNETPGKKQKNKA